MPKRLEIADFVRRVGPPDHEGCWPWLGAKLPAGYGVFKHAGYAHRFAYETKYGRIPRGYFIDHLCRFRGCVNPDHLEPVTPAESSKRGNMISAVNSRKTHCKYGHPFDIHKPDHRACSICRNRWQREYMRRCRAKEWG